MKPGTDKNHIDLEETMGSQKKKIYDLEKKIGDLYNNQNYFIEMMEKMNNLSFQILEEIRELKEKNCENENQNYKNHNDKYNPNYNSNLNYDYNTNQIRRNNNFNNYKNSDYLAKTQNKNQNNIENDQYANSRYSKEKNRNISSTIKYLNDSSKSRENSVGRLAFNYNNEPNYNNSKYNTTLKPNYAKGNNNANEKTNSFITNKYSNINNNIDDETIFSLSNEINLLKNNLNDRNDNNNYPNNINEIIPSFFKNEKLFSNFEIQEKTIKKVFSSSYDYGFFGIRCRDAINSSQGKYFFSIYLNNTNKSNINIGMTTDARMGIPGGFHDSHNSFMYNLVNCEAYIRASHQPANYSRRGKSGDIYTFYVDFDSNYIKLFLNGNELNHNSITIYQGDSKFYPCIDIKDENDSISFVDRIILNFTN